MANLLDYQIQLGFTEFLLRKFRLRFETSQFLSRWLNLPMTCKSQDLWAVFAVMSMEEVEEDGLKRGKKERIRDEMESY